LCFSIFVDLVWTIFWSGRWSHVTDFERTAHILVVLLSWAGIGLKAGLIFALGTLEWNNIKTTLPGMLQERLNSKYSEQNDEI
jgi:hypothetical protein